MPEQVVAQAIAAVQKTEDTLVDKLRRVNPKIAEHFQDWNDIDDVLEQNLLRQSRQVEAISTKITIVPIVKDGIQQGTRLFPFHKTTTQQEFIHLPKGVAEPWSEYQKRVRLTPFFPETPNIVDNRRGALFAKPPEIKVHTKVMDFLKNIGPKRQSYMEILHWLAWRTYAYGMVAIFVDFRPLPADVLFRISIGEDISEQEVEDKRLNQPVLGTFNERQILDFQFNKEDGRMDWIKLRTSFVDKEDWKDKGEMVEVFRIIDRFEVEIFEVREREDGPEVTSQRSFSHEAKNAAGDAEVPVVLIRPFMGTNDIGQSPIRMSAQADLTAARLLSDIVWNLYVHGCPIVKLTTPDTTGERAASIEWGCSRYLELRSFQEASGLEAETMEYLQLDPQGTQLLIEQWKDMVKKANETANRTTPNAATEPVPMSGIAKQWDWKTGEEKALNEHMQALQMASDDILKMLSRVLFNRGIVQGPIEALESKVRTSFDPSFEIGDPDFNVEIHERIFNLAKTLKLKEMKNSALERIPNSIHNLKDDERKAILKEIEEFKEKPAPATPRPTVLPPPPVVPPQETVPPEGGEESPEGEEEEA